MYTEVDTIVEGALENSETFFDTGTLDAHLSEIADGASRITNLVQVYVIDHDHDMTDDECECASYMTDHHPLFTYNEKEYA